MTERLPLRLNRRLALFRSQPCQVAQEIPDTGRRSASKGGGVHRPMGVDADVCGQDSIDNAFIELGRPARRRPVADQFPDKGITNADGEAAQVGTSRSR